MTDGRQKLASSKKSCYVFIFMLLGCNALLDFTVYTFVINKSCLNMTKCKTIKKHKRLTNYLVNPELYADRKADYESAEQLNKKFEMISREEAFKQGLNGNISQGIRIVIEDHKVEMFENSYVIAINKKHVPFYKAISSALLLYRIICMFPNPKICLDGAEGYKCPWFSYFRHKGTGIIIGIGEWKGAADIHSSLYSTSDIRGELKKDLEQFIGLLLSDRSPHPYDNLTAGSVA